MQEQFKDIIMLIIFKRIV